jgi:hypothetical protein
MGLLGTQQQQQQQQQQHAPQVHFSPLRNSGSCVAISALVSASLRIVKGDQLRASKR